MLGGYKIVKTYTRDFHSIVLILSIPARTSTEEQREQVPWFLRLLSKLLKPFALLWQQSPIQHRDMLDDETSFFITINQH